MQGLSSLIVILPTDSLTECQQSLQELVDNNKFWKFAKIKDSLVCFLIFTLILIRFVLIIWWFYSIYYYYYYYFQIRSSFYKLISCLAQYTPNLFIANASKVCSLTLCCLDESDPLVAASIWECALLALIKIEVNIK